MKQPDNKILYSLIVFSSTLFIYILFAGRLRFLFPTTIYNYFSFLAESFLHGSLSFISFPPFLHDLTTVGGKIYMYWGPAPVLFVLPFVFLFGKEVSDALYTSIIASFNPLILYLLLHQLQKIKLINISNYRKIFLCIFFAFGTVHFYLSIFGTVWFTSQIIAILYLLLGLLFIAKFSESQNRKILILSAVFFSLAVNSRTTLIFYFPLFLSFLIFSRLNHGKHSKTLLSNLTTFILIGTVIFTFNIFYNYFRFGSFLDTGYNKQNYAAHFAEDKEKNGFLNNTYIKRNFYYMFIHLPTFSNKSPFLSFDPEGNSILFTSPLFLTLVLLIKRKYWQNMQSILFNLSTLIGIFLIILFLLNFWGTGWVQFGYRYLLDATPLLILLLAEVINGVPIILIIALLIFSILVNTLGTLWFLNL